MSEITLVDLRTMQGSGKIPVSLHAQNLSNVKSGGPMSRVIISVHNANGRERAISIAATVSTTDVLDQASFDEIMKSPQFSDAIRKNLIRIVDEKEARAINGSEKAISNARNRAKTRGTPVEEIDTTNLKLISKAVADWNMGTIEESEVLNLIEKEGSTFNKEDLTSAMAIVKDPSSDVYAAIAERLASDFDVG